MLAANPSLTIAQIRDILRATAKPFRAGSLCASTGLCGAGVLNAGAAVSAARDLNSVRWNFSDLWHLPAETGWGLQVASQGDMQFVTWYTYASDGSPLWFTMLLSRVSQDIYVGDIYRSTGVPLPVINNSPASTSNSKVGSAILFFYGFSEGAFLYEIGSTQVKPIERLQFASSATFCYYSTDWRGGDTNYQDIWWNPTESGWGINLTHQGDVIFGAWYTYGPSGEPLWLYLLARRSGATTYAGQIFVTTGIPYYLVNGSPSLIETVEVGTGTLTFLAGDRARFDYSVFGFSGSKPIERFVFSSLTSRCEPLL